MLYNVRTAEARMSELIDAALAGEEVVITWPRKPAARLEPILSAAGNS